MRRALFAVFACAVALILELATPVVAEAPPGAPDEPGVSLTLAQCLETALKNNLDLVFQRKDPQIAEQNVIVEEAAFDPAISGGPRASGSKSEPGQVFQAPGRSSTIDLGAQLSDALKFGGDYNVGVNASKSSGSDFLYDQYLTGVSFGLNVPLLRGFGTEVRTETLLLAQANRDITREALLLQTQTSVEAVEDAYWNLLAAREAYRVAGQSLSLAQDLLSLNRKKVEVGTLAPIEITQADAGVASREEGVISTENLVLNAEDELRRLMGVPRNDPLWEQRIIPADKPVFEPSTPDLKSALARAEESRPELAQARQRLKNAELSERVAHNGVKPALDYHLNLGPYGNNLKRIEPTSTTTTTPLAQGFCSITGIPCTTSLDCPILGNPPGPTAQDICITSLTETSQGLNAVTGSYYDSVREVPRLNNYDWSTSLIFSIPIGNRAAKATYAIATLNREKAEVDLQNVEQTVRVDVRSSVRNVDSGAKRVTAARSNVTLQQKKLEAEQKKFDNGMSTSFEVLTFQNDLLNAQVSLIQAMADYVKSLAALERSKGTLLEARGLRLE